jgi:hypothetical protein
MTLTDQLHSNPHVPQWKTGMQMSQHKGTAMLAPADAGLNLVNKG